MLQHQRQNHILEQIKILGAIQVEQLAQEMDVSTMTIRRDLTKLAKEGHILRCYGGALQKEEIPYREKKSTNEKAKTLIAHTAKKLIEKENTIFLDAGTTAYYLAVELQTRADLTIVTTDMEIAQLLKNAAPTLILCGGQVQKTTGSLYGFFTNQMITSMRFDIAFVGSACIDEDFNSLTPTIEKAELKQLATKHAKKSYLMVDASKFYKQAMTKINSLSDYTGVITEKKFTSQEKKILFKKNITVINAE